MIGWELLHTALQTLTKLFNPRTSILSVRIRQLPLLAAYAAKLHSPTAVSQNGRDHINRWGSKFDHRNTVSRSGFSAYAFRRCTAEGKWDHDDKPELAEKGFTYFKNCYVSGVLDMLDMCLTIERNGGPTCSQVEADPRSDEILIGSFVTNPESSNQCFVCVCWADRVMRF